MRVVNFKHSLIIVIFLFISLFTACAKSPAQVTSPKNEEKVKLRCVMSSENASKAVIEDSSAFITGLLSVDSYTKELDNGLKLK